MDAICVVLERRQLSPEDLQSLQDFSVLQVLKVLLLQQQELHTLSRKKRSTGIKKVIYKHKNIQEEEINSKEQQQQYSIPNVQCTKSPIAANIKTNKAGAS